MIRNRVLFQFIITILVPLSIFNGCIDFDEWKNTNHNGRDFNDFSLPFTVYTDPSKKGKSPQAIITLTPYNILENREKLIVRLPTITPSEIYDCSITNTSIENWLRDTTPADTLSVSALQSAYDLYSNPRDTGKLEAIDWQKRTIEAYTFMRDYYPVPQCYAQYHDLITEELSQLSLTFSELELVYIAMDSNQPFEPYLDAAKQHLLAALDASILAVEEWNSVKNYQTIDNSSKDELNSLIVTDTPPNIVNDSKSKTSQPAYTMTESYEDKTEEIFSQVINSKRILGQLHKQALENISFQIPDNWVGDGNDIFVNQPMTSMLHIYSFKKGTSLEEVIDEYTQAMSSIYEISSKQSEYYNNYFENIDAMSVVFLGKYKKDNRSWSGLTFTFDTGSNTFLFFWDIFAYSDSLEEDILFIIDS
ncbi:MAG: hypothetical protein KJ818_04480, partial [Candidatus Omnitrophica bacterium]|nr:hypothetical protein [Candidatus Omnitrophota bacterium]